MKPPTKEDLCDTAFLCLIALTPWATFALAYVMFLREWCKAQ